MSGFDLTLNQRDCVGEGGEEEDERNEKYEALRLKRRRKTTPQRLRHEDYTVGWISALALELTAATAMLDEFHEALPRPPGDSNTYEFGQIGEHNVVLACLPHGSYGTNSAATVAAHMSRSFPSITVRLMVGVGGGAPSPSADVRLGDVVVGVKVIQYDLGKSTAGGNFERTSDPVKPPPSLMTAVSRLRAAHNMRSSEIPEMVKAMIAQHPKLSKFKRPEPEDVLFNETYHHVPSATTCDVCDCGQIMPRTQRPKKDPEIHYGNIASGNRVIKDGIERQRLSGGLDVVCFEMEAAGLQDHSCLVIRGICDYSDSHKNKRWQAYAAATAAAYAKELLQIIPVEKIEKPTAVPQQVGREIRQALLDSLTFYDLGSRHANIKSALNKTCRWFLQSPAYIDWLNPMKLHQHHGFLWISGKPGAGKSTLIKFVFEETKEAWDLATVTATISFFFNARGDQLEKSTEGMYRSLLYQILQRFPDISGFLCNGRYAARLTQENINWKINELEDLLRQTVDNLGQRQLICFIDALDECDEDQTRDMVAFLEDLCEEANQKGTRVYVCFSSRHFPHIALKGGSIRVVLEHESGHKGDIDEYVRNRLRCTNKNTLQRFSEMIHEKATGVFMWVILAVDTLNKELQRGGTAAAAERRLAKLPSRLSDLFKDILSRDGADEEEFLLCIGWILYAGDVLNYRQLYFALQCGLNPDDEETLARWNKKTTTRASMRLFIVHLSKGLAGITEGWDRVEFIHESVRDFLIKDGGINSLWPQGADHFRTWAHDRMKECCSLYMKVDFDPKPGKESPSRIRMNDDTETSELEAFPFLSYALNHFFYHADAAAHAVSQIDFLKSLDLERWQTLHSRRLSMIWDNDDLFLGDLENQRLNVFCRRNCARLVEDQLRIDPTITFTRKNWLDHPVVTAAAFGHMELAKRMLTTPGMDIERQDADGRTLLSFAILQRIESLALHLLDDSHADTNTRDHQGLTPLFHAAGSSQSYIIVRRLLATPGVNAQAVPVPIRQPSFTPKGFISKVDKSLADSPLWVAVKSGAPATVKLLLESQMALVGVDTGLAESLVLCALFERRISTFKLLCDVLNSKIGDLLHQHGPTMLISAIYTGDISLVNQILNSGSVIDINSAMHGHTPLIEAVRGRHHSVMDLLLRVKGIDINRHNHDGDTPLLLLARQGDDSFVNRLLSTERIDINRQNRQRETALSTASRNGHSSVVKLLLNDKGININAQNHLGDTALFIAARKGHVSTVKLLISADGININMENHDADTPLLISARRGHDRIVSLLQSAKGLDLHRENRQGHTALTAAAFYGRGSVVKQFIAGRGVDINNKNRQGDSALLSATRRSHRQLVKVLLEVDGIEVNTQSSQGQTPLMAAAETGEHRIVQMLLHARSIDVNEQDHQGCTALMAAAENGQDRIVKMLLHAKGMNIDKQDHQNQTALSLAIGKGHASTVDLISKFRLRKGAQQAGDPDSPSPSME